MAKSLKSSSKPSKSQLLKGRQGPGLGLFVQVRQVESRFHARQGVILPARAAVNASKSATRPRHTASRIRGAASGMLRVWAGGWWRWSAGAA